MTDQQGGINRTNTGKAHQLPGLFRCLRQCLYTEPRHFFSSAAQVGFPQEHVRELMQDIAERAEGIVEGLAGRLPQGFPASTCEPIFAGVLAQAERLEASLA